jgi:amicyanin
MKILTYIAIPILIIGGFLLYQYLKPETEMEPTEQNTSDTTQDNQQQKETKGEDIVNISIQNYEYTPSTITVKKGNTVTWTNMDSVRHNVKNETFNSPLISNGETFSYTFNEVGVYNYTCTPHPFMKGTIIVEE